MFDFEDPIPYIITIVLWGFMNIFVWKNLFGATSENFTMSHKIIISVLSFPLIYVITSWQLGRD